MSNKLPPQEGDASVPSPGQVSIIVGTSVMLTFISFWRAAAIVLCDLGSSAFFVGGISEQAIGRAAPWFILGMLVFSFALRAIYIEASVMFVRGGIYQLARTALGNTLAKFSVAALIFNYVLAGPIGAVAAGHYLVGLLNELLGMAGVAIPRNAGAVLVAVLLTLFLWWRNVRGMQESSDRSLRFMQITGAVTFILFLACAWTLLRRGLNLPPSPVPENLRFSGEALGWLRGTDWSSSVGAAGLLLAFGHSILAISGLQTIAQVNREIAHPKIANLRRASLVIVMTGTVLTSLFCFLPVMIIPDPDRPRFFSNLVGGLAMSVDAPYAARLWLHVLVVGAGLLVMGAAQNASIVGSTGVLKRVSEDGLLFGWFREPHGRYGTSHRLINSIAILQLAAILFSRGNLYTLGEAFAFGVVWTFVFNTLSIYKLRKKKREPREWRVPLNIGQGRRELPLGILMVLLVLLAVAGANLLSKPAGTVCGVIFTVALTMLFSASESSVQRKAAVSGLDQFHLIQRAAIDLETVGVRAAPVLVAVRDAKVVKHLDLALKETDTDTTDVVVMTARMMHGTGAGYEEIFEEHLFTEFEQTLFSQVVACSEKCGKPVKMLAVPSNNPVSAVVNVALKLGCSRVYLGASEKLSVATQGRLVGEGWEEIDDPDKTQFELVIVPERGRIQRVQIGAHAPELAPEDIELTHHIWLEILEKIPDADLHHRDVVSFALNRFREQLRGPEGMKVLEDLQKAIIRDRSRRAPKRPPPRGHLDRI